MLTIITRGLGGTPSQMICGGLEVGPAIDDSLYFEAELSDWLSEQLGIDIHADRLPQNSTWPGIVYSIIDGDMPSTLTGPRSNAWMRIMFDAYAEEPQVAEITQRKIYNVLTGYHITVGKATQVQAIPETPMGGFYPNKSGSDAGIYRRSRRYLIRWNEPAPVRPT